MPVPSGFRRLALATVIATLVLIVLGGIVRVSDSGLGCGPGGSGLHGWPLCRGDVVPGTDVNAMIEYAHRTAASIVGLLWLALLVLAFRGQRSYLRLTALGFGLVVAQGLLGALVVEQDLDELLVAAHLGIAMISLSLSMWLYRRTSTPRERLEPRDGGKGFRPLAFVTQFALFGAIVAGGYMAGSEKEGLGEWAKTRAQFGEGRYEGAHFACGHQFPACNDGFLPFGNSFVNIHLTHRVFVYLTTFLLVALVVIAFRRGIFTPQAWALTAGLVLQLVLGALNVWLTDEYSALILAHLTVATLLWAALTTLTMQLVRAPAPDQTPARGREPQAVAA